MDDAIDRLVSAIHEADSTVALTGAGVSTASVIPDFRGDEGIWNTRFDPADFRIDASSRIPPASGATASRSTRRCFRGGSNRTSPMTRSCR